MSAQKMNPRSANKPVTQSLRARLREATDEAILAAAERVFAAQGLHAAKMEAIASEAGVAVGTLYNHFKDREALLTTLVQARREELLGRVDDAMAEHEGEPFEAQLHGVVSALSAHLTAHQPFLAIMMEGEVSREVKNLPAAIGQPRDTMRQIYDRLCALVRRGVEDHALRPEGAAIYGTMLMGMVKSSMLRRLYYASPNDPSEQEWTAQLVRFFMRGAGA